MGDLSCCGIAAVVRARNAVVDDDGFAQDALTGRWIAGFDTVAEVSVVAVDGLLWLALTGSWVAGINAVAQITVLLAFKRHELALSGLGLPPIRSARVGVVAAFILDDPLEGETVLVVPLQQARENQSPIWPDPHAVVIRVMKGLIKVNRQSVHEWHQDVLGPRALRSYLIGEPRSAFEDGTGVPLSAPTPPNRRHILAIRYPPTLPVVLSLPEARCLPVA